MPSRLVELLSPLFRPSLLRMERTGGRCWGPCFSMSLDSSMRWTACWPGSSSRSHHVGLISKALPTALAICCSSRAYLRHVSALLPGRNLHGCCASHRCQSCIYYYHVADQHLYH